jgi:hypothetical protein
MSTKTAIRDGAIIAACVMTLRFTVAVLFGWPSYSWPEIGCLFLFAEILRLGESTFVHCLAPLVCYTLAGGFIGGIIALVPPMTQLRPVTFRIVLAALLSVLILLPIAGLQMTGWL